MTGITREGTTDGDFGSDLKLPCKYLQQRMDFIAQISTESPKWLDTACLSHQLMATFLKQRKILQYIARSEGLTATEFDENGKRKDSNNSDEKPLGFVMRFIKKDEGEIKDIKPLLNFTANDKVVFPERIPVAFPVGIIGWQAFYVILEGFSRNVAKHNYASLSNDEKKGLNIIIDIVDDGNTFVYENQGEQEKKKPAYKVRLYTDISYNKDDKIGELNNKLGEAFIESSTGEMSKANWGLAELRICADFLQQADIMDVGGDLNEKHPKPEDRVVYVSKADGTLLPPLNNETDSNNLQNTHPQNQDERFFYEFKILKPRIIGIETKNIKQWNIKKKTEDVWKK